MYVCTYKRALGKKKKPTANIPLVNNLQELNKGSREDEEGAAEKRFDKSAYEARSTINFPNISFLSQINRTKSILEVAL